jgi:hypothetical protein
MFSAIASDTQTSVRSVWRIDSGTFGVTGPGLYVRRDLRDPAVLDHDGTTARHVVEQDHRRITDDGSCHGQTFSIRSIASATRASPAAGGKSPFHAS